jgi:ubiquinone/menaquinone biosynthesis C-methylase UbiE
MEAPRTDDDIRDVNTRYHDVAADSYDAKWGIDFGEPGRQQVLMKLRKVLPPDALAAGFDRSLEIGSGTGYFSLNLLQAGVIRAATCTDISPGMLETLRGNAERLGLDVETVATDAEQLPFEDASFDLVLGHAILHHIPDLSKAFAEFHRVLKPGGMVVFAGEPSRYGDRIARVPKRGAAAVAPLWRRAIGARAAGSVSNGNGNGHDPHGLRGRDRARRGARRELVRLDEPRPGVNRRPRGRAVGLAPVRLPRLPHAPAAGPAPARGPAACGDLLQPAGLGP